MNRKSLCQIIIGLLICLSLTECQQQECMEQENSVYFWRTELRLDSTEQAFLHTYNISKVYCRYFDVVMDGNLPMPNATITFIDQQPTGVEFVPTIYITEDCMHQRHEGLAKKLVNRIMQMNETNGIRDVKEIQIDCDYTDRSRKTYYAFLEEIRKEIPNLTLSTTISLHQLQMKAPPADYGVLMLYNTGDPRNFEERNPILDQRDVQPYAQYLAGFSLPMAAAYPVYRWQRQIGGVRIEHTVEADEILSVKELVEQKRPELRHSIVIYHLDEENIKRYNQETYEAIYHH